MKSREPRRNVRIQAQMRVGASWSDTAILDLSSKGMLLHSPEAPPRGSYVEVRRGQHVIIARVVWTCGAHAGLRSQDDVLVENLIRRPDAPPPRPDPAGVPAERYEPRKDNALERSRWKGRIFQFACIALFGVIAAAGIYGLVALALAQPLSRVSAALGG